MVNIRFVEIDGQEIIVDAGLGQSLMEAAVKHGVAGIIAECGGNCVCGTCRVYPDAAWRDRLGDITPVEAEMLEDKGDAGEGVRLSCRITVTGELDGLVVHVPAAQN
jgi:ferredoxin, 2Fe-2S